MAITTACYKDVKELVSPFYDAASLPTASLNTLKNRARALYKQHKGLIEDKVQDPPRIGFDERCRQFSAPGFLALVTKKRSNC